MIGIVNRADKPSATTSSPIQTHGNNVGALPLVASRGGGGGGGGSEVIKPGKKKPGLRLWMKLDRFGKSQVLECDKNAIIKSVSIPLRDLRILGPLFSHSSNILAREKAIVVNLEFIKAIVTAQEVMLLNPLESKVVDFIDRLKQQFPIKSPTRIDDYNGTITTNQPELPFEFQILEICLETICSFLESSVLELESNAYPILDDLAMNVSTKNLERVRSLKSNLTRLLARVQKVRDEIEHLLDDNEDMAQLYLTRKEMQNQQYESLMESGASNDIISPQPNLQRLNSRTHASILSMATSFLSEDEDVEELEMLLEAYFMQLDGTRNKILSVREYIDDTEDYVNIQLDNQRNELIQLQLILTIVSFAIGINTLIAGAFAMNFKCELFEQQGLFWPFVGLTSFGSFLVLLLILGYARRKKLLGS